MNAMTVALSLENIGEASQSIDPVFLRSPQFVSGELSDRMPMDVLLVPVGNGALISGIGRWMKARNPQTRSSGYAPRRHPRWRLAGGKGGQ